MTTCCRCHQLHLLFRYCYNIEIRHLHFLWCYTVMLLVCNFLTCLLYTESNGLDYGDKPGGFCQKSRECRSGEVQSHKLPTPGGR